MVVLAIQTIQGADQSASVTLPPVLRNSEPDDNVVVTLPGQAPAMAARTDGMAQRVEALADRLLLYTDDGDATAEHVISGGLAPVSTLVRRAGLEDVFLSLTGRQLTD